MRLLPVIGASLALVLSGCGGDGLSGASATATKTVTVTSTTTLTPAPDSASAGPKAGKFDPNVGDRALRIGMTREGRATKTTLREIRYPYPPAQYREPEAGKQYVGLRISQCLRPGYDLRGEQLTATYNGEWYIASPSGAQVTSSTSYNDWPAPKFPENVTISPGECLKGWLTVEVKKGFKIEKVIWRPAGETVAEWLP